MRKSLYWILIAAALFAGIGVLYSHFTPPCAQPLHYSIGTFDPKFGITEPQFLKEVAAASAIWDKASGRTLFAYDPNASFTINLIYDSRQELTNQIAQVQGQLQNTKTEYDSTDAEYQSLVTEYNSKHDDYAAENAAFQSDLDAYNAEVDSWNAKGGAPEAEYQKLQAEKASLDKRSTALETERQSLNSLADRVNTLADEGAHLAADYNGAISTYNEKFGTSTVFDQGVYKGKVIDIYQFKGLDDLELVLTHELGHALGLDHVKDPMAVMYYLIKDQNLNSIHLTQADVAELDAVCRLKS